jgi:hypothetical protein
MYKYMKNERGVAMVLELVLIGITVVVIGGAIAVGYQASHSASKSQAAIVSAPATVANGSVDNVVNALSLTDGSDANATDQESADASSGTDSTSAAASDMGGSYDENSF